jgi:hypothetical protein
MGGLLNVYDLGASLINKTMSMGPCVHINVTDMSLKWHRSFSQFGFNGNVIFGFFLITFFWRFSKHQWNIIPMKEGERSILMVFSRNFCESLCTSATLFIINSQVIITYIEQKYNLCDIFIL